MLNHRVYRGQYKTCPHAKVPLSGLRMIHVDYRESPNRKYVNPNEIQEGLKLLNELNLDSEISGILIITPVRSYLLLVFLRIVIYSHIEIPLQYKNQQREFEYQIDRSERKSLTIKASVLTIDQCQGQESDAVILSLVRRPTRFLNLNRLNVALSRVRRRLYVLGDFQDLQDACLNNKDWDGADLLADLLAGCLK